MTSYEPRRLTTRLWRQFTEPHPAIFEPGQRSRARLLSGLLLGLTILTTLFTILRIVQVRLLHFPGSTAYELILVPGLSMLIGMYLLSRTRHYQAAALSFILLGTLLIFLDILTARQSSIDIAYLIFSVLMSSLFFSKRSTTLILIGLMLSVLVLPWFAPDLTWETIGNVETFLVIIGLLIITITSLRQQNEETLRQSGARYQAIVEDATEMICRFKPDGTLTFVNDAYSHYMGQPREALLGRSFVSQTTDAQANELREHFASFSPENPVTVFEQYDLAADGSKRWRQWQDRALFDEQGNLVEFQSVGNDITERKRMETALAESESAYRTLFANMPIGLYRTTPNGRILDVNPALVKLFGFPDMDSILAMHTKDLYAHPRYKTEFRSAVEHGDVVSTFEAEFRRQDGTTFWAEDNARAIRDEAGNVLFYEGSLIDITTRKQAEAILTHHAQTMDTLYETSLEINAQPDVPALLDVLTRRAAELMDAHSSGLYLVRPAEQTLELVASYNLPEKYLGTKLQMGEGASGKVVQSSQPLAINDYRHWEDRSTIYDEMNFGRVLAVPLKIGERLFGVINIIDTRRELSFSDADVQLMSLFADQGAIALENARLYEEVQHHAEQLEGRVAERTAQLEETNRDLQEALTTRQEFLARASHELRTPLNAILGFAQLIEMENPGPRLEAKLQHILKAGRSLLTLINDLLNIASLDAGQTSISLEPVAVQESVRESVELMQPLAAERGIQLDMTNLPPEAYIRADHYWLGQVLLNLLSNAIKYNHAGGAVTIDSEMCADNCWRINVRDNGAGLSAEQCARLFTPFDRLGAERSAEPGTGLGLSLSKRLVEAMGASIGVESVVGEGSTFWLEFPRVEAPVSQPAPDENGSGSAPTGSVLYIESDPANLQLLEQILVQRPEIKLITAAQGSLGLDLARAHLPDLILLNLNLPDLSGLQFLHRLRADSRTQAIPVVAIGAQAAPNQIKKLLAAGVQAVLAEPLDVRQFLNTLDKILH